MFDNIIETHNLTRRLPSGGNVITILDSVDVSIARGEFVAIVGPSGSGKSTLLALLAGLDRPTEGSIRIDGEQIESMNEDRLAMLRRTKVGFVFQSFHLLPNFTAKENVMLPMELLGFEGAADRAGELLEQVGLGARGHHYPTQLSGGEQQRVALARAFATKPSILFADEPTGNLDSENGARVIDFLLDLRRSNQTTLVLVTHEAQVASLADRVIRLKDGRVVEMESRLDEIVDTRA